VKNTKNVIATQKKVVTSPAILTSLKMLEKKKD